MNCLNSNLHYPGQLCDGRFFPRGCINCAKYRLAFEPDGLPTAIPHFVVLGGLEPIRYNGIAGSSDNVTVP